MICNRKQRRVYVTSFLVFGVIPLLMCCKKKDSTRLPSKYSLSGSPNGFRGALLSILFSPVVFAFQEVVLEI